MNIPFVPHLDQYEERGGAEASARALGVPLHCVVKTLVMETDRRETLLILMQGDRVVSTKQLARMLGVKQVIPSSSSDAQRHTGYQFGGTSPFGTRTPLPVYVEKTIFQLSKIYVNGGKRGFLVEIEPSYLHSLLSVIEVEVAQPNE